MLASTGASVSVTAPARLHLGFMDLNGHLGRHFGSLGLSLEQPYTRLHIKPAATLSVQGPDAARAERYARKLIDKLGWPAGIAIVVEQTIPPHAGLGSGTQMALAVGMGIARLFNIQISARMVAAMLNRGIRSGIGIGAFEQGGFVVDGGRGVNQQPPPLICRHRFPEDWRILLIFDQNRQGCNGKAEQKAFTELPLFPAQQAAHLCHLVLMRALPALAEANAEDFTAAIGELQKSVGDHFAPVQGGRFTSPAVSAVLDELTRRGFKGLGQSSWGPTGFAICDSTDLADDLLADLKNRWQHRSNLSFAIGKPRNSASTIELKTQLHSYPIINDTPCDVTGI